MNRLKILNNANEHVISQLSEKYFDICESDKKRLLAESERKLNTMKKQNINNASNSNLSPETSSFEVVEIKSKSKIHKIIWSAAACVIILVCVFSVRFLPPILFSDNNAAAEYESENLASVDTPVTEQKNNTSSKEQKETSSALNNSNSSKEKNNTSSAANNSTSSKQKNNISSSSNNSSNVDNESNYVSNNTDTNVSSSEFTGKCYVGEEYPNIDEEPIQEEPIDTEPTENDSDFIIDYRIGVTETEKIMKISADMTINQVIDILGTPETLMILDGYAQYIVDNSKLLMIHYDSSDEKIGRNGNVLLTECVDISTMYCDPNTFTFDCYAISSESTIRVTCPQYVGMNVIDLSFNKDINKPSVQIGDKLRVTYSGEVLECYPPIIYPVDIEVIPMREARWAAELK